MKRIILLFTFFLGGALSYAQGWPAHYSGVMLQGFYWDSYDVTNWEKLTEQADVLSKYFDLIWVPNSGTTSSYKDNPTSKSNGYDPCFWLEHNSCFGTEEALRKMIDTYKAKGTGIIEDVVINHKNGYQSWANFPNECVVGKNTGKTYTLTWDNTNYTQICKTDEANSNSSSGVAGKIKGAADTGTDFDGYRDLDHTNATCQANVETYLDYLLNELGYAGFRYDMVKGYAPKYTGIYNSSAHPTFSVGEYWDGNYTNVRNWIVGTGYTSAAFDFPLHDQLRTVFNNGNWSALSNKGVVGDPAMSRYAVTFVDNHDTYRDDNNKVTANVLAANAFILAMPGTPCIFYPHWVAYQTELAKMIEARKEAGIDNQSKIISQQEYSGGYVTIVQGSNKNIMVISGYPSGVSTDGYQAVSTGTSENPNYAFYISTNSNHQDTVFVKADKAPYLYAWDVNKVVLNGTWPGTQMSKTCTIGGETYYYEVLNYSTDTYNCLLNTGSTNTQQTADIIGLKGNSYLSYDGGTGLDNITSTLEDKTAEPYVATYANEKCAFFVAPASWTSVDAYAWTGDTQYTSAFPGDACQKVGTTAEGNSVWKWTYSGSLTAAPAQILFDNAATTNAEQTADFGFVNGGYYQADGLALKSVNTEDVKTQVTTRSFTGKYKSTIYLPYDLSEAEVAATGGTFYEFTSAVNGVLYFSPVTTVIAYRPYIFVSDKDGVVSLFEGKRVKNGKLVSVSHDGFTFTGNDTSRSLISDATTTYYCYMASTGSFAQAGTTKGIHINPYKCYFSTPATTTTKAKAIMLDGQVTSIERIGVSEAKDDRTFDINGRSVSSSNLPQGIYIKDHQKVIVK